MKSLALGYFAWRSGKIAVRITFGPAPPQWPTTSSGSAAPAARVQVSPAAAAAAPLAVVPRKARRVIEVSFTCAMSAPPVAPIVRTLSEFHSLGQRKWIQLDVEDRRRPRRE